MNINKPQQLKQTYQHYGSVEDLSIKELKDLASQNRNSQVKQTYQHYGSVEDLSIDELKGMAAEIQARRSEVRPIYQHYGSIENVSDNDLKIMEAQVEKQRKKDMPYKEYLNNLIAEPKISDSKQFENAVIRSMESNGIMRNFTSNLVEEISKATYEFRRIEKTDTVAIQNQKQKVENLINIYIRYLYELKNHDWAFYGAGNNIGLEMISSEMLEDLWQVQKNFDITFNMPIPKNLGEQYGQAFERNGKMIPGITLMYDDLKNKQVNWHQVLVYKENELTPKQRYQQSQEEKRKNFETARKEEIEANLLAMKSNEVTEGRSR